MNRDIVPILMGGLGEKVSNGGTQYYFQDRVYSGDSVAVSIATSFNPYYLVKVKNERRKNYGKSGKQKAKVCNQEAYAKGMLASYELL